MSISGTLASALSGLNATARAAELVANNIANAQTPGYARRELQLGTRVIGGQSQGVEVTGVQRAVDLALLSDRRIAGAGAAGQQAISEFLSGLETAIGTPQDAGSLGARIGGLDAALLAAASRPESEARLSEVLSAATSLAGHIAKAADGVQQARETADAGIADGVARLNAALAKVADMNLQIRNELGAGRDASTLMDQRQRLVDEVAAIVPIRETAREGGQIALATTGGAVLLEGKPAIFGFVRTGTITADMTLQGGSLSGLTLNGRAIPTAGAASPVAGGTLAAGFEVRDSVAPEAQRKLDALAHDLCARFADSGLDPTLVSGQPGLFTDAGRLPDAAGETGLAQRLVVNAAADPSRGGALWRLRDGMGAPAPGPPGQSALLSALQQTLVAPREPQSGGFMAGARSLAELASDVLSEVVTRRLSADTEAGFAAAKADALRMQELAMGVDTDAEMQKLLVVEQAYAANARVVQTVDDMIQLLLGI